MRLNIGCKFCIGPGWLLQSVFLIYYTIAVASGAC